ncbi:MAG: phosphatase family protein, partial [Sediminibacterium sp.]|nr:phosphatase family protein [Sediminibacterium sp.]
MKQIILSIVVTLAITVATAQTEMAQRTANYEAAGWKTKLVDNPQQITIPIPPDAAHSKAEIQTIRQGTSKLTEKQRAQITYWDAGAPSYRWNQIAPKLISYDKFDIISRTPTAWMNIAIYDATILAWREKIKYKRKRPHETDPSLKTVVNDPPTYSYPCEHSVTASAAANVLAYFFPEKADSILQLAHAASRSRVDAGVQFPSDAEAGWKLGEQVARVIIEKAKNDRSSSVWKGDVNKDPKKWTGPYPLGINLSLYAPIVLHSADQFRPGPPPDFEKEMKDLKNFKRTFASNSLAYYWANNGGFDFWSDVASQKIFEYKMSDDAPSAARVYAVLHTAFHDAVIAVFDAKYAYWGIRPVQYDSTYKSLITTPPFPGYPSGHAMGAATSCTVLEYFFPADTKQFRQLAQDCADSRFDAGIHFRIDNET